MGKVIANIHQTFADRDVAPGDVIDADEREQRVLLATGRARRPEPASTLEIPKPAPEQVETAPELPAKKRGTYNRKDMTSESRREMTATITHIEPPAAPAPAPAAPAPAPAAPAPVVVPVVVPVAPAVPAAAPVTA